jgi:diguanylate cyclase (GGDEF)-like protein
VPRRKLLLVDDDPSMLARLRAELAGAYELVEARDGQGALVQVRDAQPDLVLMDVEMPGLGGIETCRFIKRQFSGKGFIPVLLMTARGRGAEGKAEGLDIGADDYLVKPFEMVELVARVKSLLRLKALQDELLVKIRELELAQKELERLSQTDGLTHLYNRRHFEEQFAAEFARAQRYHTPLSLLMLDVDHFKNINDTRGHPAGDQVLREVAQAARTTLRDVDLVARYGGEEIVALLPNTGPADAQRAAERVRQAVEAIRVEHPKGPIGVTASLGLAWFPSGEIADHEALVRAADVALYRAKHSGRNRVCWGEE